MRKTKDQWFTLVELIVVVTISAILWTIAFMSFQGYGKDARNSTRISDMKSVEKVLQLYRLNTNNYPMPDNATATGSTVSWETIFYTWDFGSSVQQAVQRISTVPKDPKDGITLMKYSVTQNRGEYQLKYTMETAQNSVVNSAYAATTEPRVKGRYNWLLVLWQAGNYYAVPSLFADATNLENEATYSVGNKEVLFTATPINVSSADLMNTPETSYSTVGTALQTAYSGSTLNTQWLYAKLENTTDTEGFAKKIITRWGVMSMGTLIHFVDAKTLGILTEGPFTGTPTTTINGDIWYTTLVSTPTVNGVNYVAPHAMYSSAISDKNTVKNQLNNEECDYTNAGAIDLFNDPTHFNWWYNLGSLNVYTPWVYCIGWALNISGDITLSGKGNYIFKSVGALTTATTVDVLLSNGAELCDIFWLVPTLTTGASVSFNGTVIADSVITLGADNNVSGMLFSHAITTAVNSLITVPECD
jgi:prepilin-type N-terminal cleavage/methylation domain-containing protein